MKKFPCHLLVYFAHSRSLDKLYPYKQHKNCYGIGVQQTTRLSLNIQQIPATINVSMCAGFGFLLLEQDQQLRFRQQVIKRKNGKYSLLYGGRTWLSCCEIKSLFFFFASQGVSEEHLRLVCPKFLEKNDIIFLQLNLLTTASSLRKQTKLCLRK